MTKKRGGQFRSCSVRFMDIEEAAYVGAMIDAEGWVQQFASRTAGYPMIGLGNKSVEIISALLRATQVGGIGWRSDGLLTWRVCRANDVMNIAKQCVEYSEKCQKILVWTGGDAHATNNS